MNSTLKSMLIAAAAITSVSAFAQDKATLDLLVKKGLITAEERAKTLDEAAKARTASGLNKVFVKEDNAKRLTFAGRVLPLTRPMAEYAARRLQAILPQIAALNAARMSKEAAAKAINDAQIKVAQENQRGSIGRAEAEREQAIRVANAQAEAKRGQNTAQAMIAKSDADLAAEQAEATRRTEAAQRSEERRVGKEC